MVVGVRKLTLISLLFDRLHGLDDLLSLDAQLFLFFGLTGLTSKIIVGVVGVMTSPCLLEDLLQRPVVVMERCDRVVLRFVHGWDGVKRTPSPEQVR